MKVRSLAPVLAACSALVALPVAAHHNSPMDVNMPPDAEAVHNAAIEEVLLRLEDNDVTGMMDGTEMDPADFSSAGATCALVDDCEAGPGSAENVPGSSYRPGTERGPY